VQRENVCWHGDLRRLVGLSVGAIVHCADQTPSSLRDDWRM
jgi:hypothetical protein